MSKGYAVYPLMRRPQENVINEQLIRECIDLPPTVSSAEDKARMVSNRDNDTFNAKISREMATINLNKVQSLLMSFRHIARIENLTGLSSLTKLCLDNNQIKKIENLDHLTALRWLDLSFNQIEVIEGLGALVQLENLSLFANRITHIDGLETLAKLSSLSIGRNDINDLNESARALHQLKSLQVLITKDCGIESLPHYRSRVLAFVSTLKFLNGRPVSASEIAAAREGQHENLLPICEEDEIRQSQEKAAEEEASLRLEYARYNCPNESRLCDELFQIKSDGREVYELIRCDLVFSVTKELLERFSTEFTEKTKELADTMRAVRRKRDDDEKAYTHAKEMYMARNTSASRKLIYDFEDMLKRFIPKRPQPYTNVEGDPISNATNTRTATAVASAASDQPRVNLSFSNAVSSVASHGDHSNLSSSTSMSHISGRTDLPKPNESTVVFAAPPAMNNSGSSRHNKSNDRTNSYAYEVAGNAADDDDTVLESNVAAHLHSEVQTLQSALIELEAQEFNAFEALNNATLTRWKSDGVDVILQSAFETLLKLESDMQTTLRRVFDSVYDQRQKHTYATHEHYHSTKHDDNMAMILDSKEEYQKLLGDWAELRRKHLETLELTHTRCEEQLLSDRAHTILEAEQERHRKRLVQINDYIERMTDHIDFYSD